MKHSSLPWKREGTRLYTVFPQPIGEDPHKKVWRIVAAFEREDEAELACRTANYFESLLGAARVVVGNVRVVDVNLDRLRDVIKKVEGCDVARAKQKSAGE